MRTVLLGAKEIIGRRDQSEEISEDFREPQPWARSITGKHRARRAAGTLLEARPQAEPFKPRPEMGMRNPKLKVVTKPQDAVLIARWWNVHLQVKTTEDASSRAASIPMS